MVRVLIGLRTFAIQALLHTVPELNIGEGPEQHKVSQLALLCVY